MTAAEAAALIRPGVNVGLSMNDAGLVATRREGTSVFYRVAYPQILQACDIVHQVLRAQLADAAALATS